MSREIRIFFDANSAGSSEIKDPKKSPPPFPSEPKRKEDYVKTPKGKTNYPKKSPPGQPTLWPTNS